MKNRLRQSERRAIKAAYQETPYWKMLHEPTRGYQRTLSHFQPATEEIFSEVFSIIDHLKEIEKLEDARVYIRSLYNDLFCDYRDLAPDTTPEQELKEVVTEVLYAVMYCLNTVRRPKYITLVADLAILLAENDADYESLQGIFESSSYRLDENEIVDAFQEYVISDQFISDEIDDLLSNLPEEEAGPSAQKKVNQFTNKQIIILFKALFEIMLSSEFVNVKHLADFISRVSGRSSENIRITIIDVAKNGCNKKDAKEVADVLKEFSEEKSNAILDDYVDN